MGAFGVPSKTGKYRIQAVSEITRVPAATLRAWERRYGIPSPQRTASSYRLYSDHDIALIQELQAMCAEGMSPAEAAQRLTESRAANEPVPALERIDPYERARDAASGPMTDRCKRPAMSPKRTAAQPTNTAEE